MPHCNFVAWSCIGGRRCPTLVMRTAGTHPGSSPEPSLLRVTAHKGAACAHPGEQIVSPQSAEHPSKPISAHLLSCHVHLTNLVHHICKVSPAAAAKDARGSAPNTVCFSYVLRAQHVDQLHIWHDFCGCLGAVLFGERGAGGHMLALCLSCDRSAKFQDQQTSSKCKQCLSCGWRQ